MQQQLEALEGAGKDDDTLRDIQRILYSTEVRVCLTFVIAPISGTIFTGWLRGTGRRCRIGRGRNILNVYCFQRFLFLSLRVSIS